MTREHQRDEAEDQSCFSMAIVSKPPLATKWRSSVPV